MKTLSQKVAELKENEAKSWQAYANAIEREVNALLKRMGDDKGVTFAVIMKEVGAVQDLDDEGNFKEVKSRVCYSRPMLTCYYVVRQYEYIRKLNERYHKYLHELCEVEKAIQ